MSGILHNIKNSTNPHSGQEGEGRSWGYVTTCTTSEENVGPSLL